MVLVGPPGIGKSALAASLCTDRPVAWIDARGSLSAEALAGAATGRREDAELVVIDGLPADEPAERLGALLDRIGSPVLITTRRPLGGRLRHVEVPPLSPADGARLLRARIAEPGRVATLASRDLERLSEALGGVPGALCAAARRLALAEVADLLTADPGQGTGARPAGSAHQAELVAALAWLPGPVTTRLLSAIVERDATDAVADLVAEGIAEVFPSGAATVRLRPLAGPVDGGGEAGRLRLLHRLAPLLPEWEELARAVEPGGWRDQTARLREDLPALELLATGPDLDLALRAASAAAVVYQRIGPERRILELDQALPDGGDPYLAARWATFPAKAAIRLNDGSTGLSALDRRPAPPGTLLAVDQASLRARLLELAGERQGAAALRSELRGAAEGTELEGDVRYRDAVSRYWSGDFAAALDELDRALAVSDPQVHSLRVVKATILATLIRRELGEDSAELLARMLPIDPLWRRTECEEGPTVLVIIAALRADLGQWAEADALLAEAVARLLRLGRRNEAANQALQRESFVYVSGRVPPLALPAALGLSSQEEVLRRLAPFARAELLGWRAVRAAALGRSAEARVDLDSATEDFAAVGRPLRGAELAAHVVAALVGARADPELAAELLPRVTGGPHLDRMRRALQQELAGQAAPLDPAAPARFEDHVLRALLARRRGLQVAADGRWFQQPGEPAVDLERKVVLRRALAALAEAPLGLTLDELVAATWPEERFVAGSGRRRAEVAISNLRRLGLRDAIATVTSGEQTRWRLDGVIAP